MLLRTASLLVALGAVACTAPGEPDGGRDAGRDGGDAGRDGGRDAGRDGGHPSDAGPDAGNDGGPEDPVWVPLATLAEGCTIERALHPEVLFTPRWAPCAEQPEGCTREIFWPGPQRAYLDGGWFDGERGYFGIVIGDGARGDERRIVAIGRTDGSTIAAWREPPYRTLLHENRTCLVHLGLGDGHAAVALAHFDGDERSRSIGRVYHAPITEIAATVDPLTDLIPAAASRGGPQRMAVSAEAIGMWFGAAIWAVMADGRQGGLLTIESAIPQNLQVVGSHFMWEDWGALVRIAHGSIEDPSTIFRRADPGDIKGFRTDGVELTWLEGYDRQLDGHYARLELWAAPYVRDPAALEPRFIRNMSVRNEPTYGAGWYVMPRGAPRRFEIVRTMDATLRIWVAPGDGGAPGRDPLYISDHEILFNDVGLTRVDPYSVPVDG